LLVLFSQNDLLIRFTRLMPLDSRTQYTIATSSRSVTRISFRVVSLALAAESNLDSSFFVAESFVLFAACLAFLASCCVPSSFSFVSERSASFLRLAAGYFKTAYLAFTSSTFSLILIISHVAESLPFVLIFLILLTGLRPHGFSA